MMKRLWLWLLLCIVLASCQNLYKKVNGDKVVATAYGKNLYQSDLKAVMYEGISRNDSIVNARSFIDTWIRRQLLIHQAESNLSKEQLDFSQQIEDYRNSLIIFKYESELIEQNLDTVISEEEIVAYCGTDTLSVDKDAIRYILLNKRKKDFLQSMNEGLYNKAVKEHVFNVY